jgi:hypothetical protein
LPAKETGRGKVIPMDSLRIYRQSLHRETDDARQALADQGQELGI